VADKLIHGEPIPAMTEGALIEQKEKLFVDEVLAISNKWLEYMRLRQTEDLKIFYQMSRDVCLIIGDPEKYGTDAAKLLLQRHGLEVSSLKIYQMVGSVIKPPLVKTILDYNKNAEASRYGLITASHMAVLAQLPTDDARAKTLKRIQENKWSVRSLRDYVDQTYRPAGEIDDRTKRRVSVLLGKAAKQAVALLESMEAINADDMAENIAAVKSADLHKAIQKGREAREAIEQICEAGESKLAALDAAIERLVQRHNAAEARKVDGGSGAQERVGAKAKKKASAMFEETAEQPVDDEENDSEVIDAEGVNDAGVDDDDDAGDNDVADYESDDDEKLATVGPTAKQTAAKAKAKPAARKAKPKGAAAARGAGAGKRGGKSRA